MEGVGVVGVGWERGFVRVEGTAAYYGIPGTLLEEGGEEGGEGGARGVHVVF